MVSQAACIPLTGAARVCMASEEEEEEEEEDR